MNRITKLRLALARLLIPAELLPTARETALIKQLLDPEVLRTRNIEDGDGFHQQASAIQVQIDLETWGLIPGAALRSIGAAVTMPYDVHQLGAKTFKVNITRGSCLAAGLTIDPETEAWWERQDDAAKAAASKDPVPLTQALVQFNYWLTQLTELAAESEYTLEFGVKMGDPPIISPCGNGATMDISLIEAAYRAVNMSAPWAFWASKDTRTIVSLGRFLGLQDRRVERPGTLHEAEADALYDGARTASVQRATLALAKAGLVLLD